MQLGEAGLRRDDRCNLGLNVRDAKLALYVAEEVLRIVSGLVGGLQEMRNGLFTAIL